MSPTLGHSHRYDAMRAIPPERRRRITHRAVPLIAIALVALVVGIVVGAGGQSDAERTATNFTRAWQRPGYPAMYHLLPGGAREAVSIGAFERACKEAGATATTVPLRAGKADDASG